MHAREITHASTFRIGCVQILNVEGTRMNEIWSKCVHENVIHILCTYKTQRLYVVADLHYTCVILRDIVIIFLKVLQDMFRAG